jgi:hypothetical protein
MSIFVMAIRITVLEWFIQENLHAIKPIHSFHILIEISGNLAQACCKHVTILQKKLEIDLLNGSAQWPQMS